MQVKHGRIESIDVMRVLAMLAVIQIHSPWYSKVNVTSLDVATILDQLARFAVPFFSSYRATCGLREPQLPVTTGHAR